MKTNSAATINKFILLAILAVFSLFLFRLFHLQILSGNHYRALAGENRFHRQKIPANRGVFLDRYGDPLVFNKKYYFKSEEADKLFSQRTSISRQEALELMASDSAQVSYELRRLYRYPMALSHLLGYTAPVTAEELLAHDEYRVADWVGKMGLEKQFQTVLKGSDGYNLYEVNTLGEKQRLIKKVQPRSGQNIQTSLDPYLSQLAFRALGQNQGAVVISNAKNGQVLTAVSKPSFNANDLSFAQTEEKLEQQRQRNVQRYFEDERNVFFNRAVNGTYPPGSVFKLVTALAGLNKEAIDQNKTVLDEGILKVNDYEYANWYYTQYGRTEGDISLVRAIARSNDIYFYKAAEWTGPKAIAQQARQFGFGQKTGIELPSEASGLVPDPEWKEKQQGERWYLGNTYHFGIGQGDMLVSPLQVAQLTQAIANSGEICHPRLVDKEEFDHCQGLGLKEQYLKLVLSGMIQACAEGGTAYPLFKYGPEQQSGDIEQLFNQGALACKTGTAEFGKVDEQGYRKTHGWLSAIVEVNQSELIDQLEAESTEENQTEEEQRDEQSPVEQLSRTKWLKQIKSKGFPEKIVIVVLVESDEIEPFKEGSEHAAVVVETIVDWIRDSQQ